MKKYEALFLSFDGECQREGNFNEISEAWDYINNIGSKWYFYPFCFVVSNKTISDAPDLLPQLVGKRIKTIQKAFKKLFEQTKEQKDLDVYDYMYLLSDMKELNKF